MVSFHTDTGLEPLSPLIDGPVNDCLPKVWPHINQVLFQLVDVACALLINMGLQYSPKFCNRPDLGRGYLVARRRIRCGVAQILDGGTYTMGRCAVIAQTLVYTSALAAMVTVTAGTLLCWANNFNGTWSSNVARTIRSNGIDIGRCLWKLLAIICVPGCLGTQCRWDASGPRESFVLVNGKLVLVS